MLEVALIISAIVLLSTYAIKHLFLKSDATDSTTNLNPVPCISPSLPYFGNALHLDMGKCHLQLSEYSNKYGPVFKVG